MKKTLFVIFLCSFAYSVCAQLNTNSFNAFLKKGGAKTLAWFAHPTNTYSSSSWEYNGQYVDINLYYDEGYNTNLRITMSNDWFTHIHVSYDNDDVPPFAAIWLFKTFVSETIRSSDEGQKKLNSFEQYFQKTFDDMSGKDLTCLCMTILWFNY